jgi:hypothetical protein
MNPQEIKELQDAYQGVYQVDELWKGKHGQSEKEYQAGRSDAGKRISGDENTGPNYYTKGRARGAKPDAPTAPGARPVNTPKLSGDEKEYHQYNKSGAKRRSEYNKVGGPKGLPEEVDLFDYLLEYLVAEGYADTNAAAIAIMSNMSEEWKEEILDEANKMERNNDVPNSEKVYDRNERDTPNHTRKPERRPSGKLETSNQTTKRVGKQRRQDHVDTRGVKQIPGAKGVGMQFGRAF